jgi:hypothetical protein
MKTIETILMQGIQEDGHTHRNANRKTADIDDAKEFVAADVPYGHPKIVSEHRGLFSAI